MTIQSRLKGAAAPIALSIALLAQPAFAQDDAAATNADTTAAPENDTGSSAIVVTGTRIRTPNTESPVPVTSVQGEEFFETGAVSIGDVLNQLPALHSTFSQSNSTRFLGTGGLNELDLRGLGPNRTLVLVNGRRYVGADVLGDGVSVDVNSIPTDLIERVDVVTGGDSAVYGSDAIAGVVNFVLKDDYEGIQLRAQDGVSTYGDANNYYVSAVAGMNFADGRGNIAIAGEYAHQSDLYRSDRDYTSRLDTYVQVDGADDGDSGSNGIPDNVFYKDVRYGYYADGGTYLFYPNSDPYLFQPDGSLVEQTGTLIPNSQTYFGVPLFQGGNGDNFLSGHQAGLMPKLDRYSFNLIGHYEVSPAFVPFIEAGYTRTDSLSNNSGPFFTNATGSPREAFYTTNPYLRSDTADFIRSSYGDYYDSSCDYYTGGDGLPDSDQCGFSFYRSVTDLGNREEQARRETYRIVAGVKGDISDHWNYEVSVNYGETDNHTKIKGNVDIQRYLLAIDTVDEGEYNTGTPNGNIVCRSTIDPSAAVAYEFADADYAQQQLAADVAACQPANLFGEGNLSPAARDYILQDTYSSGKISQLVVNAFISGDTSGTFELPGGPIGIAAGVEYRRNTLLYTQDSLTNAGLTFYNQIPTFDPPSADVKEAFGELRIPILSGVPLADELTINLAGRVADYNGSAGTVFAYNGSIQYAPIRGLTFRANYSHAVRAPNLSDLYTPLGTNFAQVSDPCSETNINSGSSTREANCRADGVPDGFDYHYTATLQYQSGGNPDLASEKSHSLTLGAVLQPSFVPGLTLSVDYYNIKVNNVITSPSAQQILDACYDASDLGNQFCDLFDRDAGPDDGPRGEIPGQILENSLQATLLNYASLTTRGIDVNATYEHRIEAINGKLSARVAYTHVLQNDQNLDPTDPDREDQLLLELGYPKDEVNASFSLDLGKFTLGYQVRYIGHMVLNAYEDIFSKQGRPPQNADYAAEKYYHAVWYNDARIEFDPTDKYGIYVGVDNIGNVHPPQGLSGSGEGSGMYDVLGRYFYAGAVVKF